MVCAPWSEEFTSQVFGLKLSTQFAQLKYSSVIGMVVNRVTSINVEYRGKTVPYNCGQGALTFRLHHVV